MGLEMLLKLVVFRVYFVNLGYSVKWVVVDVAGAAL